MAPQMLLGSGELSSSTAQRAILLTVLQVQDEDLKKLLMSWYYAGMVYPTLRSKLGRAVCIEGLTPPRVGYYTGLYEGKQQAEQASKPPQ